MIPQKHGLVLWLSLVPKPLGFLAILIQFMRGGRTTLLGSGQVWATALQQEWSPAFLGERRQRSLRMVVSIEVQRSRGSCWSQISSLLGLTSTSVFPSRDYFLSAKDVLHIIFINVYKHNMCISKGRETHKYIHMCVCLYICKYMYILYTQNLSIH